MNAQLILTVVGELVAPGECVKIATIKSTLAKQFLGEFKRASVANACQTLVRRELLVQHVYTGMDGTPKKPGCFTLTVAGKAFLAEGRRIASGQPKSGTRVRVIAGGLRLKAWRAMRILQKFSIGDLLTHCVNGTEADATGNVGKYVRALTLAGYLTELRRAPGTSVTSNGFKRWLLVRDSGPAAPVWNQAAKAVTDANTQTVYLHQAGFDSAIKFPTPSADFGVVTHALVMGKTFLMPAPLRVGANRG